jgi:lambda family phage minor tail protein L
VDKVQAQLSLKTLYGEAFSLTPSAFITLFEIDVSDLAFDKGLIDEVRDDNEGERIFRFHNIVSLLNSNLVWRGKTYTAAPIQAEGFELNARGTLPVPRLSMTVSTEGIPLFANFKSKIALYGDLTGAKVTRIKTLAKYLDAVNFAGGVNPSADPNVEFPRDVFFIDRKSQESKTLMEFELGSILDVEGLKLPGRLVVSERCVTQYRGEGCLYEAEANRVDDIHGPYPDSKLPSFAPPVANEKNEKFSALYPSLVLSPKGKWKRETVYEAGAWVYIEKDGIKYHFVAFQEVPANISPPNGQYWFSDVCSKLVAGCDLRWGTDSDGNPAPGRANGNPHNGCLPFVGFPATSKIS